MRFPRSEASPQHNRPKNSPHRPIVGGRSRPGRCATEAAYAPRRKFRAVAGMRTPINPDPPAGPSRDRSWTENNLAPFFGFRSVAALQSPR